VIGTVFYFVSGASLWITSIVSNIIGAAAIPALGVYGPELFPTSLRGRANGAITIVGLAGSVAGLALVGLVADQAGSIGPGMAIVGAGPMLVALLVAVGFPETARRELEDLNPEDRSRDGPR
jgi:MFS family permease